MQLLFIRGANYASNAHDCQDYEIVIVVILNLSLIIKLANTWKEILTFTTNAAPLQGGGNCTSKADDDAMIVKIM